ncbi:tetratricopeptide repeat protein [Actinomadura rugatobispora]|uniref:Tetratricopeptide repeat protein n=1 Tax=Actinomadura rugatobispora TaxID=1994 RepID=A0ABW1AC66_9ACTN|nr:hypothetical protein GCM10010200_000470 [Actinomadura rugatobispora]
MAASDEPGEPPEPPEEAEEAGSSAQPGRGRRFLTGRFVTVLIAVFGLLAGMLGVTVDWPEFLERYHLVDPPPLAGSVNIVVPQVALDAPAKTGRDERAARRFGDALFTAVQAEIAKAGRVEVGRAARDDVGVYRTEAGRAERLRKDLESRDGHIAISGTLIPGTVDRLRVEIYLDRGKLDEAYQLGGLQRLSAGEFGDISANPAAHAQAQDFLLRKARLYTALIVAVGEYGMGGAKGLDRSLRSMRTLLPKLTEPAERSFGWLLTGNAEARAGRQDSAVRAYRKALAADPESVRARLGLAEIDYLRAGGSFTEGMCTRENSRLRALERLERDYQALAARLADDPHDLRPRVEFALARTRLCVLLIRGRGSIDRIETGFRDAAAVWERDTRKTWLRLITADCYAMLGATRMLRLRDRAPDPAVAGRYYQAAVDTTPDAGRRAMYERRRDQVTSRRG